MKSIMMTYPGFQKLPKGLKQLLLASESFFFEEGTSGSVGESGKRLAGMRRASERLNMGSLMHPSWKN